jgi:hypothetical protein
MTIAVHYPSVKRLAVSLSIVEKHRSAIVAALLALTLANGILSVRMKTETYDEGTHYQYGMNILHFDSSRFNDATMPVTALNALPGRIAELLPNGR